MSFTIRVMTAQDLDRVMAIAAAAPEAPQWTLREYQHAVLRLPNMVMRAGWVADRGAEVFGFAVASYLSKESEAELESLVVDAQHRRQGAGGALLAACRAWAAAQGAMTLRLEVRASNDAAVHLYHRHGFSQAGVRRAYYTAPIEDALLLRAPC
jgi:ribosomal-protein-alanine N-acetyltransferase